MTIVAVQGTGRGYVDQRGAPNGVAGGTGTMLLPQPLSMAPENDAMTALAVMMIKQKQDERAIDDHAQAASAKAEEEAHNRKIAKMRELADDTFMEGVVGGVLQTAGAVASGVSAVKEFSGGMKELNAEGLKDETQAELGRNGYTALYATKRSAQVALEKESKALMRDAKLLKAGSEAMDAVSKFGTAGCRAAQERDRIAMDEADKDIDRAKASAEAAGQASSRATEDIRGTISALRQLVASKAQLANAAIIRG